MPIYPTHLIIINIIYPIPLSYTVIDLATSSLSPNCLIYDGGWHNCDYCSRLQRRRRLYRPTSGQIYADLESSDYLILLHSLLHNFPHISLPLSMMPPQLLCWRWPSAIRYNSNSCRLSMIPISEECRQRSSSRKVMIAVLLRSMVEWLSVRVVSLSGNCPLFEDGHR